jgi:general stress protein 26
MSDNELEIVTSILKAGRTASVTTRTATGVLHSRPLAIIDDDFDGTLWFFTAHPSAKTTDIAAHPDVNVSVGDSKGWLSMSGHATVSHDEANIDRYWNPWAEAYFDGGRDDPAVALLRVDVSTIEYWDLGKPAIAQAFEVLKGVITKKAPDVGDSGTVRL